MSTVTVVDYGMGNLRSVAKAAQRVANGARVVVSGEGAALDRAERIIFPGQGAMGECMAQLARRNLIAPLLQALESKPVLGICMGLQVLMDHSDEHPDTRALGIFAGGARKFCPESRDSRTGARLKVPHIGWNRVRQSRRHELWQGIEDRAWFYFVHSYHVVPVDPAQGVGESRYGVDFCCAMAKENLFAVQFHPEKSQRAGLRLMQNFMTWAP